MRMAIFNYHEELARRGIRGELRFLETQLQRARRRRDEYLAGTTQTFLAWAYAALGQYARALELEQASLPLRERVVGWADRSFLGRMQAELGLFAQARQTLAEALARAGASGAPQPAVNARLASAYAVWLEGDAHALRPALEHVQQALTLLAGFHDGSLEHAALDLAGRLHLALGEPDLRSHYPRAPCAYGIPGRARLKALWTHTRCAPPGARRRA
jgi:tetratricopeptide (TPR) repeat protein